MNEIFTRDPDSNSYSVLKRISDDLKRDWLIEKNEKDDEPLRRLYLLAQRDSALNHCLQIQKTGMDTKENALILYATYASKEIARLQDMLLEAKMKGI